MSVCLQQHMPLDLNGDDFSALMADVVRFLAAFLDRLPRAPFESPETSQSVSPADLCMRRYPAEDGRPLEELIETLYVAAHSGVDTASGGALHAIPGTGLVSSAVADLIAGILNRYTGISVGAPAMVALEASILRWMADLMGLPSCAGGLLTSGGSMATLSALLCARGAKLPDDFRSGRLYATEQTHSCLLKAARIAGFPADALHIVAVDSKLRMDVGALRSAIQRDRQDGRLPFFIAATAGTTNTGAIDPLRLLAQVAREEGLWYHVDAAYGGFFQLTVRGRELLEGIQHADSIVLDPHKGLFVPFGTGCLLVRDEKKLQRGHVGEHGPYLPDASAIERAEPGLPNFSALSPELTRPNRGLRLWLPLHLHGIAAFREALNQKLDLAQALYRELLKIPQLHVLGEPELSVIAFRCHLPQHSEAQEDLATEAMVRHVNSTLRVSLMTTRVHGRRIARIAILNLRTTAEILAGVVAAIRAFVSNPSLDGHASFSRRTSI
jgi:aromatic-L-amino-acid decarboxylase